MIVHLLPINNTQRLQCTEEYILNSTSYKCFNSLKLLVFSGAADLRGEPLSQFLQAAGVFQFNLCFATEELLQILQELDT